MTARDALRAQLSLELGIDQEELVKPWAAAGSFAFAFAIGAALPLLAMLLSGAAARIPATFAAVVVGLCVTGWVSAISAVLRGALRLSASSLAARWPCS